MNYPQYIELDFLHEFAVSESDTDEDKYPDTIPRYFIELLSEKGNKVFDPFLGHGTTAFIAESMSRIPYGIEADEERYQWTAGQIENWSNIRHADAQDMAMLGLPKMDLCVTSPPFMAITHKWNPLVGGDKAFSGYDEYLKKMTTIFSHMKSVMKRGSHVVVHVDNVPGRVFTPLVRDFSICISESFKPVGETIIKFKNPPSDYLFSRCLIFKKT